MDKEDIALKQWIEDVKHLAATCPGLSKTVKGAGLLSIDMSSVEFAQVAQALLDVHADPGSRAQWKIRRANELFQRGFNLFIRDSGISLDEDAATVLVRMWGNKETRSIVFETFARE